MATTLQWLPPFLLLLLLFSFFFLVGHTTTSPSQSHLRHLDLDLPAAASGVHPVVLLPGNTCSQIEARLTDAYEPLSTSPLCGARSGDDGRWSRLWKNTTALDADVPCLADKLRLVYDHAAGDYRSPAGVETRALSFGSIRGFLSDDPADRALCMGRPVEALERAGYRDGETLFGAPYDFRHVTAAPGQASAEFSRFRRRLRALVERASGRNGGRPVILVSHSQGGYFALEFLNRSPLPWRRRRVKHFVMASTGAGGFVLAMQDLASDVGSISSPADVLFLSRVRRSFGSAFTALPSPTVFADDTPSGGHQNRELHRARHAGVPGGGRVPTVRGAALRDAGAAGGAGLPSAGGARDVRQRRRRADRGEAGVPGLGRRRRPRRRGPGGGVRRRRRGREPGEHTCARHGDRRRSEAGVLQVRQDRQYVSHRRRLGWFGPGAFGQRDS